MSGDAAQHNGMDIYGVLYSNNVYLVLMLCGHILLFYQMSISGIHLTANWDSHEVLPQQVHIIQVNGKICNLEREYRDCIKSRRDKIGITRHIMMHQVLYNVHVTLFIGQLHNI